GTPLCGLQAQHHVRAVWHPDLLCVWSKLDTPIPYSPSLWRNHLEWECPILTRRTGGLDAKLLARDAVPANRRVECRWRPLRSVKCLWSMTSRVSARVLPCY